MFQAAVVIAVFACTALPARAQVLIGDHEFDSSIAGWSAGGQEGGTVNWDGTLGSPSPGSLRLTAPSASGSSESYKAVADCRTVVPSATYSVIANIRQAIEPREGRCFAVPVFFNDTACQGEGSIGGVGDAIPEGTWQTRVQSLTAFSTSNSMRVELVMSLQPGSGEAFCNFDSVELYRGRVGPAVPAVSWPWLVLLGTVVLVVAGSRLRHS